MEDPFSIAERYLQEEEPRAWVVEQNGERAFKVCSALLEAELWLILDRSFEPGDGLAIYYPEELPVLKTKTPEELRRIHQIKLSPFGPGSRVRE